MNTILDTVGYKCCFKYLFRFVIICGSLDIRYNITVVGTGFEMKNNYIIFNILLLFRIPGDSMWKHDGMYFTTYDNDNWGGNCATKYHGAWWYNACHGANLNGEYGNTQYGEGINWNSWNGVYYSMKEVRMMVRKS